jgi:hypothetical protein
MGAVLGVISVFEDIAAARPVLNGITNVVFFVILAVLAAKLRRKKAVSS